MRRVLLVLVAGAMLSGCSMFQNTYDEQARTQCEQDTRAPDRGECLDRVDQNRRDRE